MQYSVLCLYTLVWLHLHHRTPPPCYVKLRNHLAERVSCHEAKEKGYTTPGPGALPSSMGWVSWRPQTIILVQFTWGFSLVQIHSKCETVGFRPVGSCLSPGFVLNTLRHTLRGEFGAQLGVCTGQRAAKLKQSCSAGQKGCSQAMCCSWAAQSTSPAWRHTSKQHQSSDLENFGKRNITKFFLVFLLP